MVTFSDLIAFTAMLAAIIKIVYDITKKRVIGQNVLVVSPNKRGILKTCEAHSRRWHHPIV